MSEDTKMCLVLFLFLVAVVAMAALVARF